MDFRDGVAGGELVGVSESLPSNNAIQQGKEN